MAASDAPNETPPIARTPALLVLEINPKAKTATLAEVAKPTLRFRPRVIRNESIRASNEVFTQISLIAWAGGGQEKPRVPNRANWGALTLHPERAFRMEWRAGPKCRSLSLSRDAKIRHLQGMTANDVSSPVEFDDAELVSQSLLGSRQSKRIAPLVVKSWIRAELQKWIIPRGKIRQLTTSGATP